VGLGQYGHGAPEGAGAESRLIEKLGGKKPKGCED
jgi:hypothetical protein